METKLRVTFLAQQPVDLLPFRFTSIDLAIPEIQLFKNWPWKSKIMAMAKVKTGGYIWSPMYNRCVYFSFRAIGSFLTIYKKLNIWFENSRKVQGQIHGNRAILAEIWQILYSALKIQGQGHDENRPNYNQVWAINLVKNERNP